MKKAMGLMIVCVLTVICITGCTQDNGAQSAIDSSKNSAQKVLLYISGPEKMVKELETAFEEERGDVLEIYHNGCGPVKQKIWSEMESGSIQADLLWAAEPSMYQKLQEEGQLLYYMSPLVENIIDEYKPICTGYYTPVNARFGVIAYNNKLVAENDVPKSFTDLKGAYFKDKIAIADPKMSSTAVALNLALYQLFDNQFTYHKALDANYVSLTKSNTSAIEKVESGEAYACIAPHDGIYRIIKMTEKKGIESSLAITWPEEGAISIQRPIALIDKPDRTDKQTQCAKDFVDFAISPEAQAISAKYGFISVLENTLMPMYVPEKMEYMVVDWQSAIEQEMLFMAEYDEIYPAR